MEVRKCHKVGTLKSTIVYQGLEGITIAWIVYEGERGDIVYGLGIYISNHSFYNSITIKFQTSHCKLFKLIYEYLPRPTLLTSDATWLTVYCSV